MTGRSPSAEGERPGAGPGYQPGDLIWIHRAGAWRPGEIISRSVTAATVRYRVTGAEGTGVDTVVIGRPELVRRVGTMPPPGSPAAAVRAGSSQPPTARRTTTAPTRPQRQPAGTDNGPAVGGPTVGGPAAHPGPSGADELRRAVAGRTTGRNRHRPMDTPANPADSRVRGGPTTGGQPGAAGPQRTPRPPGTERVVELRIFVRAPGGRPTELPLGCAVDRRTGTVHLRLPDGRGSQLDLVLARAASMILHEAVLACLDHRDLRFWVQR